MTLALAIDTGGTYTDSVLFNLKTKSVVDKAKSLTTPKDLAVGIKASVRKLCGISLKQIELACLSTTLATNAIVEGKGGRVGLIVIGKQSIDHIPTEFYEFVPGGHNVFGEEEAPLDEFLIKAAARKFRDAVDAIAVSSFLSVRNPAHELTARRIIGELTNLPVVCGHELTSDLGFQERTVTAVLNAQLLPLIKDLINAIREVLLELEIKAPIMVVKGDGTLVSDTIALKRPIKTILSGPAASIVGANFLADREDGVVVDMGGTTTDIGILDQGKIKVNPRGALIGGWLTKVEAVDITTYGLGGDSYIQIKDLEPVIGPRRVIPLSRLAANYPAVVPQLAAIAQKKLVPITGEPVDFFLEGKGILGANHLTSLEKAILVEVKSAPKSLLSLAESLGQEPYLLPTNRLEKTGMLVKSSLTPTDILHFLGSYTAWDKEAPRLAARIMALKAGLAVEEFAQLVLAKIKKTLSVFIIEKLLTEDYGRGELEKSSAYGLMLEKALGDDQPGSYVYFNLELQRPLIAIGAPVQAYFPEIASKLKANLIIPDHAEVANAVGAVCGNVYLKYDLIVQPHPETGYILHTPWETRGFSQVEQACRQGIELAKSRLQEESQKAGAGEITIKVDREDVYGEFKYIGQTLIEIRLRISALGKPSIGKL